MMNGGLYFPKKNELKIYPNGSKSKNSILCKVMQVTATNLYVDMGNKPSKENAAYIEEANSAPERGDDGKELVIDSAVAAIEAAVAAATVAPEVTTEAQGPKVYDNPDKEIATYFPAVLKATTHPLIFLKNKKYKDFAQFIDDKKGIKIISSNVETNGKQFTKQQFLNAINNKEIINWGKDVGDNNVKMTLAKMLSNVITISENNIQEQLSALPAQYRSYGNLSVDFDKKYPNAMLLEFYQAASDEAELNWHHNVLVIDSTTKKIIGIYFIGWTI
jgi:hypothetical protein